MGHSARDLRHFGFVVFKNVVRTAGKLRLNSKDFRQYCIILRGNKILHVWRRNVCVSSACYAECLGPCNRGQHKNRNGREHRFHIGILSFCSGVLFCDQASGSRAEVTPANHCNVGKINLLTRYPTVAATTTACGTAKLASCILGGLTDSSRPSSYPCVQICQRKYWPSATWNTSLVSCSARSEAL